MVDERYNVLFLCTHNSGRSIIAESILNRDSHGKFRAYSAGSQPSGKLNPHVIDLLRRMNYQTDHLRPKTWDEFAQADAPRLDFVFTVCDQAAGETCPIWPGQPVTAHWGFPDPSKFSGKEAEIQAQVADLYRQMSRVLMTFAALPIRSLDRLSLKKHVDALGTTTGTKRPN